MPQTSQCACGCRGFYPINRMTFVRAVHQVGVTELPGPAYRVARKHVEEFGVELSRRSDLQAFLGRWARASWFLRLFRVRRLRELVRLANFRWPARVRTEVRDATVLFLFPRPLASPLARALTARKPK